MASLGPSVEIRDIKVCSGPAVTPGSAVSILYRVALSVEDLRAGRYVETNYNPDTPITVIVERDQLLEGLYDALIGMRSGGSIRRVYVPAAMAFGHRGAPGVPANSDLWVELCVSRVGHPERDPMDGSQVKFKTIPTLDE
ncbi:FKBP-type peptidyl-prolyl cis-trans isomerase [Micromonospora zamorensis]|uniref:FKBP-type peptidyl-prolyl cis-trans isomerase n=1 Tax=Micromonospora zamorensis TaxID=709883 RepID=UPI003723B72C